MKRYEGLFILNTAGKEDGIKDALDKISADITTAGGNVTIQATGAGQDSNLSIQGSGIQAAGTTTLKADNQVNLLAAQNTTSESSSNQSKSASVGVALQLGNSGAGVGITASHIFNERPNAGDASTASMAPVIAKDLQVSPALVGVYVASLVVNDGRLDSAIVTTTVTAAVANVAPVANAGTNQNVGVGSVVTLDGTGSTDANRDPLTYKWSLSNVPTGSTAALNATYSPNPRFTADMVGTYTAILTVNDGKADSLSSVVVITASAANAAPVANAGLDRKSVV